jgi:protein SCO1/2
MRRFATLLLAFALSCGVRGAAAMAQPGAPSPTRDVGFDQKLGGQIPLDLAFKDEDGRAVHLRDYFGKKPVVLSLVYYGCPMLCGLATEGLVRSLKGMNLTAGKEFDVLTVSFDAREGPAQAKEKRDGVLRAYGREGAGAGWHFLTGDQDAIRLLTLAVGFRYVWDPESQQFAHATGVVTLTPQGKIARYLFGIDYPSKDLRFGLMEATNERIGSLVDQLLLLCYHYDPKMGRYTPQVLNLLRGAGALTVLVLFGGIVVALRREKKRGEGLRAA